MEKNIKLLQEEFNKIKNKGYIQGIYNNLSSIGRTFENELNLPRNTMEIPDYQGIEIKTKKSCGKSHITLFTAVPDGEQKFEIERLKNTYGYPYKRDKKYKALYVDIYGHKKTFGGIKYQYKLYIDRNQQKIFLCIYDRYDNLIEKKVSWSFIYLESKIMLKLQTLAIVNAWTKKENGWYYFKYHKINFYKIKTFNVFLDLIESGIIRINFKVDIHLDIKKYGQTYDHGCGFEIREENITMLYNKYELH